MMGLEIGLYLAILLLLVKPLGSYMAGVYQGEIRWFEVIENRLYRMSGIHPESEMNWKSYAFAILIFNLLGLIVVYLLQRFQGILPFNPAQMGDFAADSSLSVATSFVSNTNWQNYGGESTMSYLTQMLGLSVQNFLSAATGMAVLVAFSRGLYRRSVTTIGNFWVDMTRSVLYILLPLSFLLALVLVSQGVVQTFNAYPMANALEGAEQSIAVGPAASQIAIKQLGTNGGGFFNANSAHPFENPSPITNFLQLLAILMIPTALTHTFGKLVDDTRQGWALLAVMFIIFLPLLGMTVIAEQNGNPALDAYAIDQSASEFQAGGNMEGKEVRFGIDSSALWAVATTAASNGSVNSMHDSYTALGGLFPMWLMQMGEVIFGGVGSGLYGLLIFAILAVFIAGLMVGRTPEYLGKKIEPYEMKMAVLVILIPPMLVLVGTAATLVTDAGLAALQDSGAHGLSEALYGYSSAGNNNGSAFAGFNSNLPFHNFGQSIAMFLARFWLMIPVLAIAGSLAGKKRIPESAGTLPTHTPLFIIWLVIVVIVIGALAFLPALALGPIAEQLMLS